MARWDSSVWHYLSKLQSKVRPARQVNTAARGGLHKRLPQLLVVDGGALNARQLMKQETEGMR